LSITIKSYSNGIYSDYVTISGGNIYSNPSKRRKLCIVDGRTGGLSKGEPLAGRWIWACKRIEDNRGTNLLE